MYPRKKICINIDKISCGILDALLKTLIFSINFVLKYFLYEILIKFVMKKNLQEIVVNFFTKYFV